MVFQDPFTSLNPAYRVSHGILRGLKLHRPDLSESQRRDEAERVVEAVGLTGRRDARALPARAERRPAAAGRLRPGAGDRPKLILADEPVSMLDVSIRIGLLNLMAKLRDERGRVVPLHHPRHRQRPLRLDRLIVMYAGQIVESGPTEDVLASPKHPYTQLLLSAVPDPRAPLAVDAETDRGEPPRVIDPSPAAGSAGAARSRSTPAHRSPRCSPSSRPGTRRPATSPSPARK